MTDKREDVRHTDSYVKIIELLARLQERQELLKNEFSDHKKEDDKHFGDLFNATRDIKDDIAELPEKLTNCGSKIKDEIMEDVKDNYVKDTDFKVFVTEVKTGTTVTVSIMSAVIIIANIVINYMMVDK